MHKERRIFYRCKSIIDYYGDPKIEYIKYYLDRETEMGYWVSNFDGYGQRRFNKQARKIFARNTKEEALNDYILRTKKYISILKLRTLSAEKGLKLAETLYHK